MQGALPPHPTLLVLTNTKQTYTVTVDKLSRLYWRARGRVRRFEGPILRMRNTRQSGAASRSVRVNKHQVRTTLDGERVKSGNLQGAGVSSSV